MPTVRSSCMLSNSPPVVCDVGGEARLRKCAGWGRCVDRVVVGFISPVTEDPRQCPLVRMQWGFCEEEDVWSVRVQKGDQVGQ
jgi:hypothetical protein